MVNKKVLGVIDNFDQSWNVLFSIVVRSMHSHGRKHNLPDTGSFVKMLVEGPPPIRHVLQINVKKSITNDLDENLDLEEKCNFTF